MRIQALTGLLAVAFLVQSTPSWAEDGGHGHGDPAGNVELGPRPFYLVDGMRDGPLKRRLQQCAKGPFYRTDFSIAHRGAPLQFPEHTRESYEAGARMGAGIVECDVTFTRDGELVCRHSECDLHTTTNIVDTPLNAQCSVPWKGPDQSPAPKCCTSDVTLAQYRTLIGKMDASAPAASTARGYLGDTASWRTDLYTGRGTLMSLRDSLALNEAMGVKHAPELKGGDPDRIAQIFGSQASYARKLIDEMRAADVSPSDVWLQSFDKRDILFWLRNAPEFGRQAVFLGSIDATANPPVPRQTPDELRELYQAGLRYFAPPMPLLLDVDAAGEVVPSAYAKDIRRVGLRIITWTFERSDLRAGAGRAGFYYSFDPEGRAIRGDSDMYLALDVLARDVGIDGIFSDWPATVTYYANCMGLR